MVLQLRLWNGRGCALRQLTERPEPELWLLATRGISRTVPITTAPQSEVVSEHMKMYGVDGASPSNMGGLGVGSSIGQDGLTLGVVEEVGQAHETRNRLIRLAEFLGFRSLGRAADPPTPPPKPARSTDKVSL